MFELANLGLSFGVGSGKQWALRNVTMFLPSHGLVAITGKSGSGKSSLLNLLAALQKPTEGQIKFLGRDLGKLTRKSMQRYRSFETSIVFQHYNLLLDSTVLFNVSLPLLIRGERKRDAEKAGQVILERFGLLEHAKRKAGTLSGGERQRLAIARALSTNPSVIFADEPTGALDEANSLIAMELLRNISESILVIVVSHNERLVKAYADRVIVLQDGFVIKDGGIDAESSLVEEKAGPTHSRFGWKLHFIVSHIRQNALKNIIALAAGIIGFSSLLLGIGFFNGSEIALKSEQSKTLEYQFARISEKNYVEIENSPLRLVKQKRPLLPTAEALRKIVPSVSPENDFSYFFPNSSAYSTDDEVKDPCGFIPVFDLCLREGNASLLCQGVLPTANDLIHVLVNESFSRLYAESSIGRILHVGCESTVTKDKVIDTVKLSFDFLVCGVVREFEFLNSPKVYYSYSALRAEMSKVKLDSISSSIGRDYCVSDLVTEAEADDPCGSYGYLLFVHSFADVSLLHGLAERFEKTDSVLSIDAPSRIVSAAFSALTGAFSKSLLAFLVLALIGVIFILGMISYSSFVERRKESSILTVLGAPDVAVFSIFESESFFLAFVSAFISLAIIAFLSEKASMFLSSQFGISGLIEIPPGEYAGIPCFCVVVLMACICIISFIGTGLPLRISKRLQLAEELRDE